MNKAGEEGTLLRPDAGPEEKDDKAFRVKSCSARPAPQRV